LEEPTDSSEAESSEAEDFCESEAGLREGAELHNHIVSATYTEGKTNLLRFRYIHRRLCLTREGAIALRMQPWVIQECTWMAATQLQRVGIYF